MTARKAQCFPRFSGVLKNVALDIFLPVAGRGCLVSFAEGPDEVFGIDIADLVGDFRHRQAGRFEQGNRVFHSCLNQDIREGSSGCFADVAGCVFRRVVPSFRDFGKRDVGMVLLDVGGDFIGF